MKHLTVVGLIVLLLSLCTPTAIAGQESSAAPRPHSGGTVKCGCHYNRKTGEYHCHTRKKRGGDCPP